MLVNNKNGLGGGIMTSNVCLPSSMSGGILLGNNKPQQQPQQQVLHPSNHAIVSQQQLQQIQQSNGSIISARSLHGLQTQPRGVHHMTAVRMQQQQQIVTNPMISPQGLPQNVNYGQFPLGVGK